MHKDETDHMIGAEKPNYAACFAAQLQTLSAAFLSFSHTHRERIINRQSCSNNRGTHSLVGHIAGLDIWHSLVSVGLALRRLATVTAWRCYCTERAAYTKCTTLKF